MKRTLRIERYFLKILVVVALFSSLIFLASCSSEAYYKVIDCNNFLFDCDDSECSNECGKYATERRIIAINGEAINGGEGCLCKVQSAKSYQNS